MYRTTRLIISQIKELSKAMVLMSQKVSYFTCILKCTISVLTLEVFYVDYNDDNVDAV